MSPRNTVLFIYCFISILSSSLIRAESPINTTVPTNIESAYKPSEPIIVNAYFDEVWDEEWQDLNSFESTFYISFKSEQFNGGACDITCQGSFMTWDLLPTLSGNILLAPAKFESCIDNIWTYSLKGVMTWGEMFYITVYNDYGSARSELMLSTDYLSDEMYHRIDEAFDNYLTALTNIKREKITFTQDESHIQFTDPENTISKVLLVDVNGRTVHNQTNNNPINIGNLRHGVYILLIFSTDSNPLSHKIII